MSPYRFDPLRDIESTLHRHNPYVQSIITCKERMDAHNENNSRATSSLTLHHRPFPSTTRPFKLQNASFTLPHIFNLTNYTPTSLPRSSNPVPTVLPLPRSANPDPTRPSVSSFHFDPPTDHDASYPVSSTPMAVRLPASLRPSAAPAPAPAPATAPVVHYPPALKKVALPYEVQF
ncbi:hypothetical protein L198_05503 [Cryptococcus wingfieldii CBS 7118]|uniref:Uncharacterized protein n=1 Tax=Cryptococcus wingfieldii CBS 7118 TaxID=1295528 RepID=A0A1E3IVU0_9TREE|nr:hypothetical protein L198_05503 [Cryptococcus wingfieldii CBS 7118]ODN92709.1 hypothetical protein L198_05503 [Cryptococcus wingfieldii CBS 7118]